MVTNLTYKEVKPYIGTKVVDNPSKKFQLEWEARDLSFSRTTFASRARGALRVRTVMAGKKICLH